MPFDAMKGLQEALRDREERHSRVDRHEISEEQMLKNSRLLEQICKGDKISLECYHKFHDIRIEGFVEDISCAFKYVKIDEEKICFEDIYSAELLDAANK